jgi:hypothetical protein
MEIINIYDFLHLLSLIKIRLNMNLGGGGGFGICTYMPQYLFFSSFYLKENGERFTSKDQIKK